MLWEPGQKVRVIDGPFKDVVGVIDQVDRQREKIRLTLYFFGHKTPLEVKFSQVIKV